MQVQTANLGQLKNYIYTVIFAKHKNKWLFCRAKERTVFETAGGHIEQGETPLAAAERELYEETGAVNIDISPAFDYSVTRDGNTTYGQVFYAEIYKLGHMPDFEMAEVGLFDALPEKLRFPEITPVLFTRLLTWLHTQKTENELWDVYDAKRHFTGRTHRRGDPLQPSDYHLVVVTCIMNGKGEFLLTKRAPGKSWAGMWEFQGGCATAGDDSLTAAIREAKEETGLTLDPKNGKPVLTRKYARAFFDVWLFEHDFRLEDVVLQPGETVDAKIATMDEVRQMIQAGEFVRDDFIDELFAKANQRLKGD